jgi:hypothetical protein
MHAATKAGYQAATVVSVENRVIPSNYAGGDPSDTPLQSEVYSYDIGIRLGDTVYQTSYDSAFDDLPSVITTNHSVQVNLKRHVIYVNFPVIVRCGWQSRVAPASKACPAWPGTRHARGVTRETLLMPRLVL